jgi:two-component system chemotaxis response regulator CheB
VTRPRVLIIDDSAFARTVLSRLLRTSNAVDVVGTARDGHDALERIALLDPDVITLDLTMPSVDGLAVLRALAGRPRPKAIVVSISGVDTELGAEALLLGAVDLVTKPSSVADDRLNTIGTELIAKILAVGTPARLDPAFVAPQAIAMPARAAELVMIGTSTGGPQALTQLISALPQTLRAPVTIALHIPAGYTEALAKRLDKISPLTVVEATDGLELVAGMVVLARGGSHLRIVRRAGALHAEVSTRPARPFAPSVDERFLSGARATGDRTLGVILTGMGDDGLEGSRAIAAAHGSLLTEAAASCVVYGMPRVVYEAGLGAASVPLSQLASEIARRV